MSDISRCYQKPPLNIDQQLKALIHRGLVVKNPDRVGHYLRFIGYYSLSGYLRSFQIPGNRDHVVFKKDKDGNFLMSMEVGGLQEVMSWVMGVSEVVPQGACFELSALSYSWNVYPGISTE